MKLVNNSVPFNPSSKKKPLDVFHSNLGMICSQKQKQQNPSFISLFSAVFLSVFNLDLPSAHRRTPTNFLPPASLAPLPPIPHPRLYFLPHILPSSHIHTYCIQQLFLPYARPDSRPVVTGSWHFLMDVEAAIRVLPPPSSPGAPHLPHSFPFASPSSQASRAEILYNLRLSACLFILVSLQAVSTRLAADPGRCCASSTRHKHILVSVRAHTHMHTVQAECHSTHGCGRWHVTENRGRQLVYMHIYI